MENKIRLVDAFKFNRGAENLMVAAAQMPQVWLPAPYPRFGNAIGRGTTHLELKGSAELQALVDAMKEVGASSDPAVHQAFGAAVREPIRTLARYQEWAQYFFAPDPRGVTEDNAIPLDLPIGSAFVSSPDGRVQYFRPGVQQWTRPLFAEISGAFEMPWKMMEIASWAMLSRRLEEVADSMARQRDTLAQTVLDAAIATVSGHAVTISGGALTKTGLDTVIKSAVQTGFPITQVVMNPARIMDMTAWTFGTTSAIPWQFAPESAREQMFQKLYAEGYGGLRYMFSHNLNVNSIYLSGDPQLTGYHQDHGQARSYSYVDGDNRSDKHSVWEDDAYVAINATNLWSIAITA